ncbi:MAG: capsular biosynthesis protein [Gammaproteobacteria bacterium]|nr:capsular biosynthesis protein [Gammaproteobacteria bacterium]
MRGNVLLLQGPMGPFFRRLAQDLERQKLRVHKVNFNGGDDFFYRRHGTIHFVYDLQQWPGFLEQLLIELAIDYIYLFGDCRTYHAVARDIAKRLGVQVFVFEEGYLRPDHITLEEEGVNGYSRLPQDPVDYPAVSQPLSNTPIPVGHSFSWMAIYAQLYYLASRLSGRYPDYVHHRPLSIFSEGSNWIFSLAAKSWFNLTERAMGLKLKNALADRYFLVPLQVHCDMQIRCHSPYKNVEQFIVQLVNSFAAHAPAGDYLVFKHHPLDRGYRNYTNLIHRRSVSTGIVDRVIYVHDLPLPALLMHARGTVVINSTAALSSIHHGTPVKVLGKAVYDLQGLTSQQPLARFWNHPEPPDRNLYLRFRAYLVAHNQINGNFYKRLPKVDNTLGVIWPERKADDMLVQHAIPSARLSHS